MRSARFVGPVAGLMLLVACGAPSGADIASEQPTTPTSLAATASDGAASYAYELTATAIDRDSTLTLRGSGVVDLAAGVAELRFDAPGFASLAGVAQPPPTGEVVIVQTATTKHVRGVSAAVLGDEAPPGLDPDVWYEAEMFDLGGADAFFLDATLSAGELWGLVGDLPPADEDSVGGAVVFERSATSAYDSYEPHFGSNTVFDMIGRSADWVALTTREDSSGRLALIRIVLESGELRSEIRVEIFGYDEPVTLAAPIDPQPWPEPTAVDEPEDPVAAALDEARQEALDELRARIVQPDRDPMQGVVVRLSMPGGWELPEAGTVHLTIEADGRVVRVADTSVFSSTTDYSSLTISSAGIARVLDMVVESGILTAPRSLFDGGAGVSATDRSATLEVTGIGRASMDRIGSVDGYTAEQIEWRAEYDEVIARLVDLSWLAGDIVEPEDLWIPDSMTLLAGHVSSRSGLPANAPFAAWPLPESIDAMATRTTVNPYDEEELVICLTGEDVEPVFSLLTGVNHAYLRVDDGSRWELNVEPHYPGYRLITDPCP